MPQSALIYLSSLGSAVYRRLAGLCVRSLRGPGGYRGRLVVVSDNGFAAPREDVEVLEVERTEGRFERCAIKAAVAARLEAQDVDVVLWVDADQLAVGPVEPLLAFGGDAACAMVEEPWTRMSDPPCGGCLTEEERRRAEGRWGINAGLLRFPGSRFRELADLWSRLMRERLSQINEWCDQPFFNALVVSGRIPFRAYPRGWIEMPPMYRWHGGRLRITEETLLLHFCWGDKDQAAREMEVFLEEFESRAIRA